MRAIDMEIATDTAGADIARKMGVYDLAAAVGEYCDMVPRHPATRARPSDIEKDEAALDPKLLLFLDGRLHAAPLDEILRLDDCEDFDIAIGLDGAPRREAQCNARFGTVVDHDQIGAFRLVVPHEPKCCVNPRFSASGIVREPSGP